MVNTFLNFSFCRGLPTNDVKTSATCRFLDWARFTSTTRTLFVSIKCDEIKNCQFRKIFERNRANLTLQLKMRYKTELVSVMTLLIGEGGVISDKIYCCVSRARLKTWNYELFVQNCR